MLKTKGEKAVNEDVQNNNIKTALSLLVLRKMGTCL